jgi:hypothetical protein
MKHDVEVNLNTIYWTSSLNGGEWLCFSCFNFEGRASVAYSVRQDGSQRCSEYGSRENSCSHKIQSCLACGCRVPYQDKEPVLTMGFRSLWDIVAQMETLFLLGAESSSH